MLEHEFILNYTRTDPVSMARSDLVMLNWRYILEKAKAHNVAPLLYSNIKNLPVPQDILKELERIYTYTAFHNMLYLEELQGIVEKTGNKITILKGPMLAQEVYGNIALRPFIDMDILVRKDKLGEIKSILINMGYLTRNEKFYKKYHFHMPFTKINKMPIHIELHWEFVDRFILNKIDMNKVWNEIKNNKLPPEINILYLLIHIEKHAFFNKVIYNQDNPRDWIFTNPCGNHLIWYTDLYELIKKYKINWQRLLDLSGEWCIQNIVYYNLYTLNKLYPNPVLENLPQPILCVPKRLIYNIALKNARFKLQPDMQLRPIRVVDLINYLFPPLNYYCKANYIPAIIIHLFTGLREILNEFLGICKEKLSTDKKKEYPAVN